MMLAEYGMGYKRIAALAGIGVTPARNIIWGRQDPGPRNGELQKHVKRETAEALLSVRPNLDNLAGGARIPARGTHRRVQALVCLGWSQSKLCQRVGIERANWFSMMHRDEVTVRVHRAVAVLFDELWNQQPPRAEWRNKIAYARTIGYAKKHRWLPPMAWDDIDLDEVPPVPDEVGGVDEMAIELAIAGEPINLSPEERREAVRRLHRERWSDASTAAALHCSVRTVLRIRQELGLEAFEYGDLRQETAA